MAKRSYKLDPALAVAIGGKRRPRVDRARELFSTGTKSLAAIRRALCQEFEIGDGVAKMDVADMIREMHAEQSELRPQQRTLAIANLETAFHAAMRDGKYSAAIRALELHAKITGLLEPSEQTPVRPRLDFSALPAERRAAFREDLDTIAQAQRENGRPEAQA